MPRHIVFIDPIEKLIPKKDSSLLLAHALKQAGHNVKLLFKDDYIYYPIKLLPMRLLTFNSKVNSDFYLGEFSVG